MKFVEYPLSPSQLHLWKSQVISPDSPLFNQVSTATLPTTVFTDADAHAMCQAWENLQRLHPVFTTRILDDGNGNPIQQINEAKVPLAQYNIEPDTSNQKNCLQEWIQARSQHSFVLNEALVDAALVRRGPDSVVIYLNMHHLIADALSTAIIWRTLFSEFARLQVKKWGDSPASQPDTQSSPTNTFRDYVLQFSSTAFLAKPKKPQVALQKSEQPPLPGFYDQLPGSPTTRSTRLPVEFSDNEYVQLQLLPEQPGYQLINRNLGEMCVHLTALAIFLRKITDDVNIVIDAPIAGRFEKRWGHTVGNFIEMIRLRVAVNDDDTIMSVYAKTRNALFSELGKAAPGCTAYLQAEPIHGVLNILSSNTMDTGKTPAEIHWHHPGHSDTNHPFRLHVSDWNATGTPSLEMDLNHAWFDDFSRNCAPRHLAATYRAIIQKQTVTLRQLSILTKDDRWNFIGPLASNRSARLGTVPEIVEESARLNPQSIALADEHESLSYSTLLERSSQVSRNLQHQGIGQGDRVAVLMPRALNLPIIILGVLRTGAAYIPIDSSQPRQRVLDILNEASASCVICDTADAISRDSSQPILLASDLLISPSVLRPDGNDNSTVTTDTRLAVSEDPAYIIFTSGSTGKPKGVVISHGALMTYLTWAEHYYRLSSPIAMPLFTSIAFDLTVTSLFLPWLSGGHIQVHTQSVDDPATLLFSVLADTGVNTVKLTPAHLALLAHSETTSHKIEQLIVGGEDLKCATAEQTRRCFTQQVRIVNEYGPTEVTVGSVVKNWTSASSTGSVPIGLPIAGTSAYVLDENGQPQLEGMVGELYLGGDSLASGYWNDETMTAECFIQHPWQAGQRLYRTGDLVRVRHGELSYLGRMDAQININGYRVELAEVEAVIASHPQINECVVLGGNTVHTENTDTDPVPPATEPELFCKHCGLSSRHPDAYLNIAGLCQLCSQYAPNQSRVDEYFKTNEELTRLITDIKAARRGRYDAVVLLSGGKDSTFALSKLVDLGLTVYAFSLDNGFISDQAKNNIDTVCRSLGVDHHYATTAHMNDIFVDSLSRYSNVCHGCFKTIYNLSMAFADEHDIDYVFTGLSRGQLFETRLNNDLFSDSNIPVHKIDDMVQAARIQYHAIKDAPNTLLGLKEVNNGSLPSVVSMIDFYRYFHVEMADMLNYLQTSVGWVRPEDTGRSTNCLINDVGIHVHKLERGFHNYSLPYSWDVRLGHKTRSDALEELNDEIDIDRVESILDEIGYVPEAKPMAEEQAGKNTIHAFLTVSGALEPNALTDWLDERLPTYMHPQRLVQIASMPLSASGKIDRQAISRLPSVTNHQNRKEHTLTEQQRTIARQWKNHLSTTSIGPSANFFQIGGDSLSAIRCVMSLRRDGYQVEPADLFRHPVLTDFCRVLDSKPRQSTHTMAATTAPKQFASLKTGQSEKLKKLLQRGSGN